MAVLDSFYWGGGGGALLYWKVFIFTEFHITSTMFCIFCDYSQTNLQMTQDSEPLPSETQYLHTHIAQSFIGDGRPEVGFHDCYFAESEELKKIICKKGLKFM